MTLSAGMAARIMQMCSTAGATSSNSDCKVGKCGQYGPSRYGLVRCVKFDGFLPINGLHPVWIVVMEAFGRWTGGCRSGKEAPQTMKRRRMWIVAVLGGTLAFVGTGVGGWMVRLGWPAAPGIASTPATAASAAATYRATSTNYAEALARYRTNQALHWRQVVIRH